MKVEVAQRTLVAGFLAAASVAALPVSAHADSSSESSVTTVNIVVMPFAMLEFDDPNPLLYLEVPPPGSTVPSAGVAFTVTGNSNATLSAEPDAYIQIPAAQYTGVAFDPYLGRAAQLEAEIGYDIELRFPIPGPNSGLPLNVQGPAVSPAVNISGAGGAVGGVLHLIANPNWTSDGGLPLPGLYEGEIILTLTAS